MAKTNTVLIKLVSSADTGYYYVTKKKPADQGKQTRTQKIRSYRPQTRPIQRSQDKIAAQGGS